MTTNWPASPDSSELGGLSCAAVGVGAMRTARTPCVSSAKCILHVV